MKHQRFVLVRKVDSSRFHRHIRPGKVAEGVMWSDGTLCMRWTVALRSTAVYDSLEELLKKIGANLDNGRIVTCSKCGETAHCVCTHLMDALLEQGHTAPLPWDDEDQALADASEPVLEGMERDD